jgi:hypothetical protein
VKCGRSRGSARDCYSCIYTLPSPSSSKRQGAAIVIVFSPLFCCVVLDAFSLFNTIRLKKIINKLNFESILAKGSIFVNRFTSIILYIHIDDIAIIGLNQETINSFINSIKSYFKIKELGLIKDYFNVKIDYRPKDGYLKLY